MSAVELNIIKTALNLNFFCNRKVIKFLCNVKVILVIFMVCASIITTNSVFNF